MRPLLVLLAAAMLLAPATAAAADSHALVQVDIDTPRAAAWLRDHRTELDVVFVKPGAYAHVAATAADLELLRGAGLALEILEPDMEAAAAYPDKGAGFGVWHTYSESEAWMDSLHALYPQVVSAKWSLGQSHQGRDIWCFRVSDNPESDEDEPEILIDGLHHAREIMAAEFPVMFAEHLAQNYGSDPELTWLVDNRELYVVPMVNPDGFVYNEITNPAGGGMWRKNRRQNFDGTWGVDLNRNYPYMWGYNDSGSSPTPASDLYRGPSAASEPEVQAMIAFVEGRQIRAHDSVHTYSNLLLFPWGYTATPCPDDAVFAQLAATMTAENGYVAGPPPVILYDVNGGAIDWMYGAPGHQKILSFSTEIGSGSDGFWPDESRRGPLFLENLEPHLELMRAAGPYVAAHTPVTTDDQGGSLEPGEAGLLAFTVENRSAYASLTGTTVTATTADPWLQLGEAQRTVGALAPLEGDDLSGAPLPFTVDPACPDGHLVEVVVTVPLDDLILTFPLAFRVGPPVTLLADDFEAGTGNWTSTGTWGWTTDSAHSPTHAVTDSPGQYPNYSATSIATAAAYPAAGLAFWHRYAIEDGWDFGRVQVSADGGPWATLASFTGYRNDWHREEYDLSAWAGQDVRVRFLLETDGSVTYDGWTVDDVEIHGAAAPNGAPPTPAALGPDAGAVTGPAPALTVANVADPEGSPVVYGFRVYADALCTQPVAAADGVPAGDGATAWTPPDLPPGSYWWRAWAGDGILRSPLSDPRPFTADDLSAIGLPGIDGLRLQVLGSVSGRGAALRLSLPAPADVSVTVHDLRGALVRRLQGGRLEGGTRTLVWDGRDGAGRTAASGVYLVRVEAGGETASGRVVLVR